MDLARLVRYEIQRWRCTYPHERAQRREREGSSIEWRACRVVLFVSLPHSHSLSFSLPPSLSPSRSLYGTDSVSTSTVLARFSGGGSAGRRLAAHGRRSDLELLSHGVGTFMPYQHGIRDEFNSDWSLSITSSLSGPFSLFASISTAFVPFRLTLSCYNCA